MQDEQFSPWICTGGLLEEGLRIEGGAGVHGCGFCCSWGGDWWGCGEVVWLPGFAGERELG